MAIGRPRMAGRTAETLFSTFVTDDWHLWMHATRNQRTIAAPAAVQGVGYWSGRDVRVEFRPAAADTGIVFVRADLRRLPADSRHDRAPHRNAAADHAALRRGQRGDDRAHHGRPGRPANRQLRGVGRSAGDARLRRLLPAVRRSAARGGHRRARRRPPPAGRSAARFAWATRKVGSRPGPAVRARRSCSTNSTTAAATRSAGNRWKSPFRPGIST